MSEQSNRSPLFTCPSCGAELPPSAQEQFFCEFCGASLPGEQPEQEVAAIGGTEPEEAATPGETEQVPVWLAEMSATSIWTEEEELPDWLEESEPPAGGEPEAPPAETQPQPAEPRSASRNLLRRRRPACAVVVAGALGLCVLCMLSWALCSGLGNLSFDIPLLSQSGKVVTVMANQPWQTTGVTVRPGQTISITYLDGTWGVLGGSRGMQNRADAGGFEQEYRAAGLPLANAPVGALLGRIDNGPPFLVSRELRFRAREKGVLQLMINDQWLRDNVGAVRVQVQVTSDG